MPEITARLSTALADRYAVKRELGQGGMAIVYLADDLKHGRKVAIKVLRPELAAALGPERFLREIEIAAGLHHPHVLPLYDSGDADGFLYYVMPLAEGESLRDRLSRENQLPLDDALQIARDVADALSYAHSRGVVHRDIKPDNILLESGHAVVTDFGIARAIDEAGGEKLTQTGLAIGTLSYMSPEQATGQTVLDGRSDVYALGCVLYEMLVGEPPYTGPTPQAIIAKRFSDPIPSARRIRQAIPETIDTAIHKALEPAPADRFATALEFSEALLAQSVGQAPRDLRWKPWVGAAGVGASRVGVVLGIGKIRGSGGEDVVIDPITIVMTTPIINGADAGLGPVVARALERAMLESPYVRVMPPNEIADVLISLGQAPTGALDEATAMAMAERSGAGAVVVPTLTQLGTAYLLNATVLAPNGETRAIAEAAAQDESALIVALDSLQTAVRRELGESRRSLQQSRSLTYVTTSSVEAFRLFVEAEALLFATPEQAVERLQRATELDSTFAMAWIWWSVLAAEMGLDYLSATEHLATLTDRMDDFNRLLTQFEVTRLVDRDAAAARDIVIQVLQSRTSNASQAAQATIPEETLYNGLMLLHTDLGEFDAAEEIYPQLLAAEETGTTPPEVRFGNGAMVAAARHDTSGALDRLNQIPGGINTSAVWYQLHVLAEVGEYARAAESAQRGSATSSPSLRRQYAGFLGTVEALRGRPTTSRAAFAQAVATARQHVEPVVELGMILQHAQAEFFVLDDPARAAATLLPLLRYPDPRAGLPRRYVAQAEALRAAICEALPVTIAELPGGDLQCEAPSRVDSAAAWIETIERMGWEHLAAGRLPEATDLARWTRLTRAGGDGARALLPAAVAYERMGRLDSAAAIYEEIVRLSPIGDGREFTGYSLAYEQYALRRLVAIGGSAAEDAQRQLRHAWQDAELEFRRRVVERVLAGTGR
ncbi:MAG: serine/threonine-protein kinase [Gemmatimonadales bacterium]